MPGEDARNPFRAVMAPIEKVGAIPLYRGTIARWTKTTTKGTGTFVVVFVPSRIDAGNKRQFLE